MKQVEARDIFAIKTLSYPIGTAQSVFYQENWVDEADNTYYSRIRHLDRTTRKRTTYGADQRHDHAPQLSQDGQTLAFLSQDQAAKTQVFIQATSGGSARQLTHEPAGVDAFFWAAADILYTTHTPVPAAGKLPVPTVITQARYKLNGAGFLPEGLTYSLRRQALGNKSGQALLTSATPIELTAVSPDGTKATYSQSRMPADPNDFSDVATLLDLTTGEETVINQTVLAGSFSGVAFAHDGTQLLVYGTDNHAPNTAQNHLWHYDLTTQTFTDVTAEWDLEINGYVTGDIQQGLSHRVAAYATTDYYLTTGFDHGRFSLYAGGPSEPLAVILGGDRQISDWSLTPDGRGVLFTASTLTTPSQLRYLDLITEEETLLVDPNTAYQRTHTLVTPEHFTFTRDGFALEGWYYRPTTTGKHPVVLDVHGGPQVGYGYTFFHEMQVLASAGYGVIAMNPRGGQGYGEAFQAAVIGHYGQGDYDDLMMGVDQVLALDPTADATHLYVTGGSYGGFMTNWIVTHTDRFKAAATQRSIANWLSFYGTSDIGYYFTPWELTGDWAGDTHDIETLWAFSPLKYVDAVTTPTLVLHSEQDYRCPIGQGEEFYMALRLRGVDTRFVRFPQSNHDLSRTGLPNLRLARLQEILDWFDHHR
ncbi:alpha/beta hydrolase family protein [Lacticaseibacillus absianus]|uniref:alpha/beta hydrolase family protein n=1 Tax=Lacticaseibacillus absianus TaxID=2729623 RepID=UPI0015CD5A2B|nr:S9 family peptidase [Lacticaseibacillus absianus]